MSSFLGIVVLAAAAAAADTPASGAGCAALFADAQKVKRVPGAQYAAGGLHRMLLGSTNRRFWTAEVEVPVLDLQSFAGGLTAKERTGKKQTRGLRLETKDGRSFRARSIEKEIPEAFKNTPLRGLAEDQLSANHPVGGMVATPLAHAAEIPSVARCLAVIPDDPALGEFRADFAGLLVLLEEMPRAEPALTDGLPAVTRVVDTDELLALLGGGPAERVDARAFLRARLFDIWLSDWDRHGGQWDWGRRKSDGAWVPIPKDRDRVFENHNGLLIGLMRLGVPHLMDFNSSYRGPYSYMSNSRDLDRRLLAELDQAAWSDVAGTLQAALSDDAIARGMASMPEGFQAADRGRLVSILKTRRDNLGRVASDFYRLVSRKVDIYATDAHEIAEIERFDNGEVEVRLAAVGARSAPYYRRRFVPDETGEIRVYLSDGNDRVVATGRSSNGPTVRVVGGNGEDAIEGPRDGIHLYDVDGPSSGAHTRPFDVKLDENGNRPRDFGSSKSFYPIADIESDIGLILGAALRFQKYGFRADPFRSRQTLSAETATRTGWRFGYEGEWHRTSSPNSMLLDARFSQIESLRFYGFGNETRSFGDSQFHHVDQDQYLLAPSYVVRRGRTSLSFGPIAKYSKTHLGPEHFIGLEQPYGSDEFGQVGGQAGFDFDAREPRSAARKGVRLRLMGSVYPKAWSVEETFGETHGDASLHLPIPIPLRPSLNFRVGGMKVFGLYPFHEAAYIGGTRTVRGISRNRFAGDAYAFGNAELRLRPFKHLGLFGLADVGRVFLQGEDSNHWHPGFGGGLWLSFKDDKHVLSFTTAKSEGHVSFYVKSGLAF